MDYTCKNCGNLFGDHLTICPSCGTPVDGVEEETKVADAEPEILPQTEAEPQVEPQPAEAQQAEPQQATQQPYQQQATQQPYQQQATQQQPYQQPYQQQPYQQQPYQQQAYQQQAYQQQPYQQQPYQQQGYQQQGYQNPNGYNPNTAYTAGAPGYYNPNMPVQPKSKLVAGLLGIFLGGFGVHNFYLGYTSKAVIQIIVSLITCGIGSLWGFIEGILIIAGSINTDANGMPLGE